MKFIPKFTNSVDQVEKKAGSMIFDINKKSLNFDYQASDGGEVTRYELKGSSGSGGSGLPDFSEAEAGSIIKVVDNDSTASLKTPLKADDTCTDLYLLKRAVEEFDISTLDWENAEIMYSYSSNGGGSWTAIGKVIPAIEYQVTYTSSEESYTETRCFGWMQEDEIPVTFFGSIYQETHGSVTHWGDETEVGYICEEYVTPFGTYKGWTTEISWMTEMSGLTKTGKYLMKWLSYASSDETVSIKVTKVNLSDNQMFSGSTEVNIVLPEELKSALWTELFNAHGKNQVLVATGDKMYEPFIVNYIGGNSGWYHVGGFEHIYFNTEATVDILQDNFLKLMFSLYGGEVTKFWPSTTEVESEMYAPFSYFLDANGGTVFYALNAAADHTDSSVTLDLIWLTKYSVSESAGSYIYAVADQIPVYTSSEAYQLAYLDTLTQTQTSVIFDTFGWAMDSWSPEEASSSNDSPELHCFANNPAASSSNEGYDFSTILYWCIGKANTLQPFSTFISPNGNFVGYEKDVKYKWTNKANIKTVMPGKSYMQMYYGGKPDIYAYLENASSTRLEFDTLGAYIGVATYCVSSFNISYSSSSSTYSFSTETILGTLVAGGTDTKIIFDNNKLFKIDIKANYSTIYVSVACLSSDVQITAITAPSYPINIWVQNNMISDETFSVGM